MSQPKPPLIKAPGYFCPYCGEYYKHFDPTWSCRDKCHELILQSKIQPGDLITVRKKHIKFSPLQPDLFIRFRYTVQAVRIQNDLGGQRFSFIYEDENGKEQTVHELYIVEKAR
ncbi:hypothetical protein HN858_03330 [Candidatus Falkowbacteria bacterium]|jgi:hypothetical protein|nr:hypothetical protein [Candidatus Falkowbacteria bacterium]MBT5503078.1 hypothetical protein [Candidatus Falkowbacteria bacterium]MBT6574172.1 hypothetical protein [Candidatus Falkowbacteria bacterium]MBT7348681.1 hypothetical protein [Candidatus Falkowbacteria bacterium]MBT7500471.1 hypothetical protein [Candidatus Falkowbacteria bacterium]